MRFFKKIFCIFVLATILFIGSSFAETGKVNVSATRLREENNTDSNILTNIYEGDKVNILSEAGDWYKVQYDGKTGYVKKEYISLDTKKEENTINTSTSKNTTNTSNTNTSNTNTSNTNTSNTNTSNTNTSNSNTLNNNTTNMSNTNTIENNQTDTSDIVQNSESEEVITTNSVTSIRNIPNMISQTISTVEQSKQLKKLEEMGNWIKVTDGNITGWILKAKTITSQTEPIDSSNFTNTTNENTVNNNTTSENKKENSENTTTNTSVNKTGTINVETANVRETASSSANVIGFLDYNDKVNITDENGEWYKITSGSTSGYVNKKLITISDDNQISSRSLTEERKSVPDDTTVNQENSKSSNDSLDNTNTGDQVAEYAKQYLGCSYVVGGKTPTTGFDCSGFTRYVYLNFGYTLGNTAASQTNLGTEISRESLQIGDLILFYNEGKTSIGHTGIYIGNGDFIHAANPQRGVVTDNLNTNSYYNERFVSARRIVN